jgi:hypothetical protein
MADRSAQKVADKYVSRGGAVHGAYDRAAKVDDLLVLGSFLAWQGQHDWCGGYQPADAWAAMCRLLDLHPVEFRKAIQS